MLLLFVLGPGKKFKIQVTCLSDEESRLAFVGHHDRLVERVNGITIMRTNMYMFVPVKSLDWGFSWEEVGALV